MNAIPRIDNAVPALEKALQRIECPSARKAVIMSKWDRGELSASAASYLIRKLDLVSA
jgi:hypothetical protein